MNTLMRGTVRLLAVALLAGAALLGGSQTAKADWRHGGYHGYYGGYHGYYGGFRGYYGYGPRFYAYAYPFAVYPYAYPYYYRPPVIVVP